MPAITKDITKEVPTNFEVTTRQAICNFNESEEVKNTLLVALRENGLDVSIQSLTSKIVEFQQKERIPHGPFLTLETIERLGLCRADNQEVDPSNLIVREALCP